MSDTFSLRAEHLGKEYREGSGDSLRILRDIDIEVTEGQSIAIIGDSGAGKTTLLNLLGGIDAATSGEIFFNQRAFRQMKETERCRFRNRYLGFVYQFHHLLPEFTALENVAMPLLIDGVSPELATTKASEMLSDVGLGARLDHKPGELSGGERQRTAIARALIHQPGCMLADEPTGNLDKANAQQVLELILDMKQKHETAMVVVTHDLHIAEQMDRIYRLEDGTLHPQ